MEGVKTVIEAAAISLHIPSPFTSGTCAGRAITAKKPEAWASTSARSAMPSSKSSHWSFRTTPITRTTSTAPTAGQSSHSTPGFYCRKPPTRFRIHSRFIERQSSLVCSACVRQLIMHFIVSLCTGGSWQQMPGSWKESSTVCPATIRWVYPSAVPAGDLSRGVLSMPWASSGMWRFVNENGPVYVHKVTVMQKKSGVTWLWLSSLLLQRKAKDFRSLLQESCWCEPDLIFI